jgi:hypothetical protein
VNENYLFIIIIIIARLPTHTHEWVFESSWFLLLNFHARVFSLCSNVSNISPQFAFFDFLFSSLLESGFVENAEWARERIRVECLCIRQQQHTVRRKSNKVHKSLHSFVSVVELLTIVLCNQHIMQSTCLAPLSISMRVHFGLHLSNKLKALFFMVVKCGASERLYFHWS